MIDLTLEEANYHEIRLIRDLDTLTPNGYNVADGGKGGYKLAGYTTEQMNAYKQRQREMRLGKKHTKESCRKMSQIQSRLQSSKNPEVRQKISGTLKRKGIKPPSRKGKRNNKRSHESQLTFL